MSYQRKAVATNKFRRRCAVSAVIGLIFSLTALPAMAVPVTDGLTTWLRASDGIAAADGGDVLVWQDQSGNGNDAVYNAANGLGELAPSYDAANSMVGGQATVRFDNQHALELDLTNLVGSDYTVVVVNGRDRTGLANFYLAGDSLGANQNLILGYEQTALLRQSHFANDLDAVVENYTGDEVWSIDTFTFSQTSGRSIFHNGVLAATDASVTALSANSGTTLGHFRAFGNFYWFQGDLAEVAIYDRALNNSELALVNDELSVRYGFSGPVSVPEPSTFALLGAAFLVLLRKIR